MQLAGQKKNQSVSMPKMIEYSKRPQALCLFKGQRERNAVIRRRDRPQYVLLLQSDGARKCPRPGIQRDTHKKEPRHALLISSSFEKSRVIFSH